MEIITEESFYSDERLKALSRQAVEEGRILSLKNDIVFKSFFSKDSEESHYCRCRMISAVIGKTVVKAKVLNPEILPDYFTAKVPRLDILCELDDGSEVDVEIQQSKNNDNQEKRAVYYAAKMMSGILRSGDTYEKIPNTYQIMFTDFKLVDDKNLHHDYLLKDSQTQHILTDCLQVHFIELPKIKEIIKASPKKLSEIEFWTILIAMGDSSEAHKILHSFPNFKEDCDMAETLLKKMSRDDREWYRQIALEEAEIEYGARMASATKVGLEQGSRNKAIEIAKNMLAMHIGTTEQIAQVSGLSIKEVQELAMQ
ncbi:MAG: Rpn family recombination-promoting nuclease/putative transposase [Treponema sp.]|nr:Rpn family recombination-promoting nuclease/putative transposase [Treponema sp.]